MDENLFNYIDLNCPEYDYLGHFKNIEYICQGHNDLAIEDEIDAGEIPNLNTNKGMNTPSSIGSLENA